MEFSNPPVGSSEELTRSGIKSQGFVPGVSGWRIGRDGAAEFSDVSIRGGAQSPNYDPEAEEGATGWRIGEDGSAFFSNVSIGGTGYFIDSEGNASFAALSVNDAFFYQGTLLEDLLWALPRGITHYGSLRTISASANSSTEFMFMELSTEMVDGRMYRIAMTNLLVNGTVAGDIATIRLRDGGSTSPTNTSNLLQRVNCRIDTTSVTQNDVSLEYVFSCDSTQPEAIDNLMPGTHRLGLSLGRPTGTGSVSLTTSNNTLNPITLYLEDMGPVVPSTAQQFSTGTGGGNTQVTTYTKTYNATWSRFYNGDGSVKTTNGEIGQGYYSSAGGNYISWIGFDSSQIMSDLSGATITKVEVYLYFDHWYNNAGGTAIIGTHSSTATSAPAYDGTKDNQDRKRVSGWAINAGKWVDITSVVGSEFKTGTSRGIIIGKGPSTSHEYYGKARGFGESGAPKLRITYKK